MRYRRIAIALAALALAGATVSPAAAQWRHGGWHHHRHHGWGPGIGAGIGFATGAIIGSALAGPRYYSGGPYVAYDSYAMEPAYSNPDAYCSQRFRSYDPASGTYLGYDGLRHPCP